MLGWVRGYENGIKMLGRKGIRREEREGKVMVWVCIPVVVEMANGWVVDVVVVVDEGVE